MRKITLQFRKAFGALYRLTGSILMIPFSQNHRFKTGEAYNLLKNPFHGPHTIPLSDLLGSEDLEVTIAPLRSNEHNTTEFELLAICSIIKDKGYNTIFEIGTYDGRTTRAMAMNLKNESGKVYTLNLPSETKDVGLATDSVDVGLASKVVSGERFINTPQQAMIQQLWGDSATFDYSLYKSKIDLVFIDGAHSESYVQNDTIKSLQMVKQEGGWILWHDVPYFGIAKFLKNWINEGTRPIYFIKNTTLAAAFIKNGKVSNPPI